MYEFLEAKYDLEKTMKEVRKEGKTDKIKNFPVEGVLRDLFSESRKSDLLKNNHLTKTQYHDFMAKVKEKLINEYPNLTTYI